MKRISILSAAILLGSVGLASAETTTSSTTTWTNDQGTAIREYSTTKHYNSFSDPSFHANVGTALPQGASLYPLPESMNVPHSETYSYSIVNNHPVVVERSTRKVVHTWD